MRERECGNCHIPMHKKKDEITFTPTPRWRYRWVCPKCGADVSRHPEANDFDVDVYWTDSGLAFGEMKRPQTTDNAIIGIFGFPDDDEGA